MRRTRELYLIYTSSRASFRHGIVKHRLVNKIV